MKPSRRILFLFVVVASIIGFWLKPGINTAKDTTYVRYYEDTDANSKERSAADTVRRKNEKIYKSERISSKDKVSKITPSKFSRAIQFEDTVFVMTDTIESEKFAMEDLESVKH